jgi:flagellar protein FlaJ
MIKHAINKIRLISIIIGILIIIASLLFLLKSKLLFLTIGIAVIVAFLPFLLSFLVKESKEKEKETMFLEFARNLVESVKAGTPISKSIASVSEKDYGPLTPHVKKLASQVSFGIPVKQALQTFARETNNKVILRSVALIIEAENSGGEIGSVLDAVVTSVSEIEEIKKERASRVYSMIVQGYIIFLIFLVIMLFVQIKFMPLIFNSFSGSGTAAAFGGSGGYAESDSSGIIKNSFFILVLIEALFTGLVVGKLSEGSLKSGVKHSVILLIITFLALAISKIFG